ncbi:MAG: YwiC-like family protein, partial [Candidatus Bathyarchaeota archaeon]|nr:YwiC-like family protein [Candidatus Bathyarchaeota archaeon]
TSLFLAHEPLAKFARTSKHGVATSLKDHWKKWLGIYLLAGVSSGLILLLYYQLWHLVTIAVFVSLLLTFHLYLTSQRRERSVLGELTGGLGLTSSSAVTYYAVAGEFAGEALLFWLLNALYFASGIFYVKMRVSRFLKPGHFRGRALKCGAYHLAMVFCLLWLAGQDWIPGSLLIAYLPILVRSFWSMFHAESKLNIKWIGYTEVIHTVVFTICFVTVWKLSF